MTANVQGKWDRLSSLSQQGRGQDDDSAASAQGSEQAGDGRPRPACRSRWGPLVGALVVLGALCLAGGGRPFSTAWQAVRRLPMPPDGRPLALWLLAGPGRPLAEDEVAVTYLNQGDLAVERLRGVIEVRRYVVKGRLEQIGLFVAPFRAIVFNRPYLISYRAAPGIPETVTVDDTFHHYDTQAEGEKMELRKAAVRESYRALVGREPSEREMLTWLDDLTRGVYPPEMEVRLAQSRAACEAALARAGEAPPETPWAWLARERRIARVMAGDLLLEEIARPALRGGEHRAVRHLSTIAGTAGTPPDSAP